MRFAYKLLNVGLLAVLSSAPLSVLAQEAVVDKDEAVKTLAEIQKNINSQTVVNLPLSGLRAVSQDGQIHFLSETGRFVITGQIYDVLSQKYLDRFDEIREVSERIPLHKLPGINLSLMNTFSHGTGAQQVTVFVDPECEPCRKLMNDAEKLTDYTFTYIPVPAFGEASNVLGKRLACARSEEEGYEALKQGKVSSLPVLNDCQNLKNDTTLLIAHMLRVDGVPFVIAPNGSVARGYVHNLKEWLEWNK